MLSIKILMALLKTSLRTIKLPLWQKGTGYTIVVIDRQLSNKELFLYIGALAATSCIELQM